MHFKFFYRLGSLKYTSTVWIRAISYISNNEVEAGKVGSLKTRSCNRSVWFIFFLAFLMVWGTFDFRIHIKTRTDASITWWCRRTIESFNEPVPLNEIFKRADLEKCGFHSQAYGSPKGPSTQNIIFFEKRKTRAVECGEKAISRDTFFQNLTYFNFSTASLECNKILHIRKSNGQTRLSSVFNWKTMEK